MRSYIVALLVTALIVSDYIIYQNTYFEFVPVLFKDGDIIEVKASSNLCEKLKPVLAHYNESYKEMNGIVFIKRKLAQDKNLRFNYTNKAFDTSWRRNNLGG